MLIHIFSKLGASERIDSTYIRTQDVKRSFEDVIVALDDISRSMLLIQVLMRDYAGHLRNFLAIGKEAEKGALRNLSAELDQRMSQIVNLRRLNQAGVKAAKGSIKVVQRGPYHPQIGAAVHAAISSACESISAQIDTIGTSVEQAGRRLQTELEELFEAALLHDAEAELTAFVEELLSNFRQA